MKKAFLHLIGVLACSSGVICCAQTNADFFYHAGCSAFSSRNYEAALTNFTSSIKLNPRASMTYNWRGRAKFWLKDYSGAIADYDKAINLDPECGGYYCNRGEAKVSLKMIPEALADYNKAIELDPKNAQAYYSRGALKCEDLTNYTEAVADLTKAIELHSDPQEEDLFFWLGNAKMELKDYTGAIADYRKSLELNTNTDWGNAFAARTNIVIARKLLLKLKKKN